MAKKANKYWVIDESHPHYGYLITCVQNEHSELVDVKTGDVYKQEQLRIKPESHAVYGGFSIGRLGLFVFARDYSEYHSYQFGVCVDCVKHDDAYCDIECRFACFGVGVRFVWLAKTTE